MANTAKANGFRRDLQNGTLDVYADGTKVLELDGVNGLGVKAGRLSEYLVATDVDATDNTLTVAQIVGGIVVHTSVTGGGTVTTDTAAHIIAGSSGKGALNANGQSIICYYINDGNQTLTLAGGTDVTISDTGQTIAENEAAVLLFVRTAATTVTAYVLGA